MTASSPLTFAHVNGVTIHYHLHTPAGGTSRPTLVFINSLGTDFRIWNAVADALADEWQILTYDKRGHGLSQTTPHPYAMDDHIGDVAGLMDHLGIGQVIPIGISVGGMISQGLIKRDPARVVVAILCCTGHKIGAPDIWNPRIETALSQGIEPMADAILERWFPQNYRDNEPVQIAGWRAMVTRTPADGYAGTSAALRDTDYTDFAPQIAVPCLCIAGEHDLATPPALVRELASLIPGAEFAQVDGAGHLPPIDKPDDIIGCIKPFLERVAGA